MTDRTLDLKKALREAQLQRLEASLSAKCATPTVKTQKLMKEKSGYVARLTFDYLGKK